MSEHDAPDEYELGPEVGPPPAVAPRPLTPGEMPAEPVPLTARFVGFVCDYRLYFITLASVLAVFWGLYTIGGAARVLARCLAFFGCACSFFTWGPGGYLGYYFGTLLYFSVFLSPLFMWRRSGERFWLFAQIAMACIQLVPGGIVAFIVLS